MRRAVDDGRVDDLAAPAPARIEQRRQDADDEVEGSTAEVADEVDGDLRRTTLPADRVAAPR